MRKALLIGVQTYDSYSESIADAVANDIKHIRAQFAELGLEVSEVIGDDGGRVDRSQILLAVARFLRTATTIDDLVIYVSGHGYYQGGTSYIVPTEADPDHLKPAELMVPLRFDAEIQATQANSITIVFDACRADDGPSVIDPPAAGGATTFIYSASPGQRARVTSGSRSLSVFTRALTDIAPTLPVDARLDTVEATLRTRISEISTTYGLPRQDLEIVTNVDPSAAPFPLFGAGPLVDSKDRWSRLLQRDVNAFLFEDCPEPWLSISQRLLPRLDRMDSAAPRLTEEGTKTAWAERGVGERVLGALSQFVSGVASNDTRTPVVVPNDINRLVAVGMIAAVDASFRAAEADLLTQMRSNDLSGQLAVTVNSDPALKRALTEDASPVLREWVAHVASVRACIKSNAGNLSSNLAEVARVVAPTNDISAHQELTEYLEECVRSAFDTARAVTELSETKEVSAQPGFTIEGRRLAACLRQAWLMGLDSRTFPTETGLHLVNDQVSVAESLACLERAKWIQLGNVIDLDLQTESAALDRTLRSMCLQISDDMLAEKQPGAPFHRLTTPAVATASRVRAKGDSYRLPHVYFRVSVSETQALLMGTNLYGDAGLAVRELYQNALDACNYRRQRRSHVAGSDDAIPWIPRIVFNIGSKESGVFLECRDNGIGMSRYELRESFAKAGKRFRDLPEYTEEEAEWRASGRVEFQPISQFGIGVFSYFMLADELEMWTTRIDEQLHQLEPLHVRVKGGGGLFQVRRFDRVHPDGGGTIVRLHLRPGVKPSTLPAILSSIIQAPIVDVDLHVDGAKARSWQVGTLYNEFGNEIPSYRATDRVYFHDGVGSLLLNGIPVENGAPDLAGATISIDGRANPELTVDRRTLRSFDRELVMEELRTSACQASGWNFGNTSWLTRLFDIDIKVGVNAYRAHRDREICLFVKNDGLLVEEASRRRNYGPGVHEAPIAAELTSRRIVPSRDGIHRDDQPLALRSDGGVVTSARRRSLASLFSGDGHVEAYPKGLPPNDEQLLALHSSMATEQSDEPLRNPYDINRTFHPTSSYVRMSTVLGVMMRLAEGFDVGLGSACSYAWAVAFVELPQPILLSPRFVEAVPGTPDWDVLRGLGSVQILGRIIRVHGSEELVRSIPIFPGESHFDIIEVDPYEVGSPDLMEFKRFETSSDPGSVPEDLSAAARLALSEERDAQPPYLVHEVPALNVAVAAVGSGTDVNDLLAELARAGRKVLPPEVDWFLLKEAMGEYPFLPAFDNDDDGFVNLPDGLDDFREAYDIFSPEGLPEALRLFARAGISSSIGIRLADVNWPTEKKDLKLHSKAITANFGEPIGWSELVAVSSLCRCSYAEARRVLLRYQSVLPCPDIPDVLPETLGSRSASPITRAYFLSDTWSDVVHTATSWALRGIHQSATTGAWIEDVAREVAPVLDAMGEDATLLRRVAEVCPGGVVFDDLVVLGAGQVVEPSLQADLVHALAEPFVSEDADSLRERVGRWLGLLADLRMSGPRWPVRIEAWFDPRFRPGGAAEETDGHVGGR